MLFERDVLRSIDGTSSAIANKAYEHAYAAYFQDRWKPSSKISIKAGVRAGEQQNLHPGSREGARRAAGVRRADQHLGRGVSSVGDDAELRHRVQRRAAGACFAARRTADTSGSTWAAATARRTRRTCWRPTCSARTHARTATLNQSLPGGFPLGLNFGGTADDSIHNGRTYVNEFSGSWEHRLPHSSSFNTTFVLRRSWDYQSGDDLNVIRNPTTGALVGPSVPAVRHDSKHLQPQLHLAGTAVAAVPLHQELRRRLGDERQLLLHPRVELPHAVEPDVRHAAVLRDQSRGRHVRAHGAAPSWPCVDVRQAAVRHDVLGVLHLYRRQPPGRADRRLRLERDGADRDAVERPRGVRSVLQRRLSARAQVRRGHADRRRFASGEHPAVEGRDAAGRTPDCAQRRRVQSVQCRRGDRLSVGRRSIVEFRRAHDYVPARVGQLGLRFTF